MKQTNVAKTVFVGLSGGVDSSLAAALLLAQGYKVVGVYMKNWTENVGNLCCSTDQDAMDARLVAEKLGIPFYVWNFEAEYRQKVMGYFFAEYQAGRTPNPDVMCNREIKFKLFLERALALGADFVATGHYARVNYRDGYYRLLKGRDVNKDQSYFLCALGQQQLAKSLFPVGEYTKPEVRALAAKYQLHNAAKPDSQGICFIGEVNIKDFLRANISTAPGEVIEADGQVLGRHEGLAFYTIGQREGLTMLSNGPWYVVDKRLETNQLVVSRDGNHPLLWRQSCQLSEMFWTAEAKGLPWRGQVSIRYRHEPAAASLSKEGKLVFVEPQRAITPGQLAVFYEGEELVGSAVVSAV